MISDTVDQLGKTDRMTAGFATPAQNSLLPKAGSSLLLSRITDEYTGTEVLTIPQPDIVKLILTWQVQALFSLEMEDDFD